jgi:hypothetical protein
MLNAPLMVQFLTAQSLIGKSRHASSFLLFFCFALCVWGSDVMCCTNKELSSQIDVFHFRWITNQIRTSEFL